ncbi:MAG: UDP-N-acetylglucosamine 2-epimerase (hydrolyzing) [Gammaproteobacteria bacterium]|nr:UDP-N-acetylglucosamine 2-epimerase (hydrolyzing) [Gammaproteobacteria bacterium]
MKKRKIAAVTGSRAEYGLLYPLLKTLREDRELELSLVVTGMHLSPEFGSTWQVIEEDGFRIDAKVEMLLSSDTPAGIAKSIGLGVIGFADIWERLAPDIIVLLGDRYEIFAAAQAALVARIPIAHIHGGETTEGAFDEAIRHSITKMAQLHFVAAEPYRKRVIQLGELPERVFNTGAPALDNIRNVRLLNQKELEKTIGFSLGSTNFLVTCHPVTLGGIATEKALSALFEALDAFPSAKIIFTKSNADTGGRMINRMLDDYAAKRRERVYVSASLGLLNYLSAIQYVDVVIGNSSSGLIEVPFFKKPTVNLGDRQRGRLRASSVIDCAETTQAVIAAIHTALSKKFRKTLANTVSPYGKGNAAHNIKKHLKAAKLHDIVLKKFHDL